VRHNRRRETRTPRYLNYIQAKQSDRFERVTAQA
jgi:hypothetical protein